MYCRALNADKIYSYYAVSLNFQSTYCNLASEIALKTHEIPKSELQTLIEFCWDKFDKKTLIFGFSRWI